MRVTIVVFLGALSAWSAPPLPAEVPVRGPSLAELAEQYRASAGREDAVATALLWTEDEIEAETDRLLDTADSRTVEADPGRLATPLAAAALLTDVARYSLYQGDPGRARRALRDARRLVESARSAPGAADFARRFYLVGGSMLQVIGNMATAHEMLSEGRRWAENDAELLAALGVVIEGVATLREYEPPEGARQPYLAWEPRRFDVEGDTGGGGQLRASLPDAQALYSRALEQDPDLLEARLRLGRVLLLRGKTSEALRELEAVRKRSPHPDQVYMARLFEGRACEKVGDLEGALEAFSAASAIRPEAQSAIVATGRTLDQLGRWERAQEAFDRALGRGDAPRRDPWIGYMHGQPDRIDGLVAELGELVQ